VRLDCAFIRGSSVKKLLVALALSSTPAPGGTTDDGIPDSAYLKYAEGFKAYTAVVRGVYSDGRPHVATATLIADHWAITAAHVVHECRDVTVGDKAIDRIVIHPDWSDRFGEHDIALLHSPVSFGLDFYPPLATKRHNVGSTVSVVGYGVTGRLSRGHDAHDGRLRAGTNTIERYERHMIVCGGRRGSSPMEFLIAPGDSGGPLFCGGELAGINSLTMRNGGPLRSAEGEESGHTDVSEYAEWVRGVISQ
jgi:hypothetical protein